MLNIKSMRYNYTPVRMAKIQSTAQNDSIDEEQEKLSFIVDKNTKWATSLWDYIWPILFFCIYVFERCRRCRREKNNNKNTLIS